MKEDIKMSIFTGAGVAIITPMIERIKLKDVNKDKI